MFKPLQIIEENDHQISIKWSDGLDSGYSAPQLRRVCPCASCVNEWTGEKILRDEQVADGLTFNNVSLVGRYALNFVFSDKHDTGIYTFQMLRNLANPSS